MESSRKPLVLVVDDDSFFRKSLQGALADERVRCLLATNGEEGLDLYRRTKPDLVILDRIMPHSGGTRFVMGVRDNPNRKDTILVIYSSTIRAETDIEGGKDAETRGFSRVMEVPKSVPPSDLAHRVRGLILPREGETTHTKERV